MKPIRCIFLIVIAVAVVIVVAYFVISSQNVCETRVLVLVWVCCCYQVRTKRNDYVPWQCMRHIVLFILARLHTIAIGSVAQCAPYAHICVLVILRFTLVKSETMFTICFLSHSCLRYFSIFVRSLHFLFGFFFIVPCGASTIYSECNTMFGLKTRCFLYYTLNPLLPSLPIHTCIIRWE